MRRNVFLYLILLLSLLLFSFSSFAQNKKATLVVVGEGCSKDEAIMSGIRNAIEQTCGALVFSTTEIENRKMVVDRIVSMSSGKISSYRELSCTQKADGCYAVSLEVKIGIADLSSVIVKDISKEMSIEIDLSELSNAYLVNEKLRALHETNELEVINNLESQLISLIDKDIYYVDKFKCSKPIVNYDGDKVKYELSAVIKPSQKLKLIDEYLFNTLKGLSDIKYDDLKSIDEGLAFETKTKAPYYYGLRKKCKLLLSEPSYHSLSNVFALISGIIMEYSFYENNRAVSSHIDVDCHYSLLGIKLSYYQLAKHISYSTIIIQSLSEASNGKYTFK